MKKNILIANCGSIALGPSLVKMLRNMKMFDFKIFGVDSNEMNSGSLLVDKFYKSPLSNDEEYISFLVDLCQKESIDVILSTSIENVSIPVLENYDKFLEINTKILSCDLEVLKIANDKSKMLTKLKYLDVPQARFFIPKNVQEFKDCVYDLGYPEKNVVVKPVSLSGSRGFRIVSKKPSISNFSDIMKKPDIDPYIRLKDYYDVLVRENNFPDLLVMEYLPGQDYSVYVYAKEGVAKSVVPMKRLKPKPGVSLISQVRLDEKIISMSKKIVKHFNLNHSVNLQMKMSSSGEPMLYEINPRIAGTISLTAAANSDHLKYSLCDIFNIDNDFIKPTDNVIMYRYLESTFKEL